MSESDMLPTFGAIIGVTSASIGLYFVINLSHSWRLAQRSREWPTTIGIIKTSMLENNISGEGGDTAKVLYEYTVGGVKYSSDRVTFGAVSTSKQSAMNILAKYEKQNDIIVYYDPNNPNNSVLEPGKFSVYGFILISIIGLFFFCVGIKLIFFM